jgi:hypothetical protein
LEIGATHRLFTQSLFLLAERCRVNAVQPHKGIFHGGFRDLFKRFRVGAFAKFHEIVEAPFAPIVQAPIADIVKHVESGTVAVGGHVLVNGDDDGIFYLQSLPTVRPKFGHVAHFHTKPSRRRFRNGVGDAVNPVVPVARNEFEAEDILAAIAEGTDFHTHLTVVVKQNCGGRAVFAHIAAAARFHIGRGCNDRLGNRTVNPA